MKKFKSILFVTVVFSFFIPSLLMARQNTFTAGVGGSYDFRERSYDTFVDDPDTEENEADISSREEDDYEDFVVTPIIHFISEDIRDNFELRIAPQIRYDLINYDGRWNSDFLIAGDRYMTRTWQLEASNSFLIRDYFNTSDTVAGVSTAAESTTDATATTPLTDTQVSDPQLSPDIGNDRYWRNLFRLGSNYTYKEDSLFRVAFDFTVLRGDEDNDTFGRGRVEDYDRYALRFFNDHRYTNIWSSIIDLGLVRGDFEETDPEAAETVIGEIAPGSDIVVDESNLSNDLDEYYARLGVNNSSSARNIFSLFYDYTGARYEEALRDDIDIHQGTLGWRHDYSPSIYTRLGIGPSYLKPENQDEKWDWNGIAELNYTIQRGNIGFIVEKGFTVDNFSGSGDRGFVDFWDARFAGNYNLTQYLALRAELGYLFEDRSDPVVAAGRLLATGGTVGDVGEEGIIELEQYERDRYRAGLGASYTFWRNFTASVDYFYLKQETDRFNDNYDDHRILLTISWAKELFRW